MIDKVKHSYLWWFPLERAAISSDVRRLDRSSGWSRWALDVDLDGDLVLALLVLQSNLVSTGVLLLSLQVGDDDLIGSDLNGEASAWQTDRLAVLGQSHVIWRCSRVGDVKLEGLAEGGADILLQITDLWSSLKRQNKVRLCLF